MEITLNSLCRESRKGWETLCDQIVPCPFLFLELICSRDSDWTRTQPSRKLKLALEGTFYTLAYTFLIELHGI
jgi:hypothetical protein